MPADFPVVELWRVLAGQAVGRERDNEVTVFDSVGFALEDFSALRYIYRRVCERDIGVDTELIPRTEDPKDLFRHTRQRKVYGKLRSVA
jgi:ornithine cyclodeaminase